MSEASAAKFEAPVTAVSHGLGQVPLVSAVIPCLNEEATIGTCITKIFAALKELGVSGEVVVADNGSTDGSVQIATAQGARIVHQPIKGYGAAIRKGIEESRGEIIIMADADDSYDWATIAPFVRKISEGYDLVMGNRFQGGIMPGAMPALHRYLGNPVLSAIARIAFGVKIGDFHCGMRAFRREAAERMLLQTDGMEFATEMIANAACQGMRITEIPTKLYPDKRNRPPHLRSFRDGWRHLRFILTYAPDYMYLAPGLGMLGFGLVLLAFLAGGPIEAAGIYVGIHFLALGALLALAGYNIFNLGVFAKALMVQRYSGLRSRTVDFFRRRYSLEGGLVIGALMIFGGMGTDLFIFFQWLASDGAPMDATVHAAFVATTALVLGMNVLFSSFLLSMIIGRERS